MKISCEIIEDLLPLYHDGVCSNESKVMVEEHLSECDSCKAELQAMDGELPIAHTEHNLEEAAAVKELSKKWKKGMFKSLLEGILITVLVVALLALILFVVMGIKIIPALAL